MRQKEDLSVLIMDERSATDSKGFKNDIARNGKNFAADVGCAAGVTEFPVAI